MNLVKLEKYAIDGDARIQNERAARCERVDALTVKRRSMITEVPTETTPEAHRVEEWLARHRACDETTRLDALKRIVRLPVIKGRA